MSFRKAMLSACTTTIRSAKRNRLWLCFRRSWKLVAFVLISVLIYLYFRTPRRPYYQYIPFSSSRHLPLAYWRHRDLHPDIYNNYSCSYAPDPAGVVHASAFWQSVTTTARKLLVYGAYWDDRFDEPVVRVLLYADSGSLPVLLCQLWYLGEVDPKIVRASVLTVSYEESRGVDGASEPYVLSCVAPYAAPIAVSVVTSQCEHATNVLNVQGSPGPVMAGRRMPVQESSGTVAACLTRLDKETDFSVELVEWLEFAQTFKVERVYVYLVTAHRNVLSVLDHYRGIGLIDVTHIDPPPVGLRHWSLSPEAGKRFADKRALLPLNDCLFRSLGRHRWIVALHLDEMIVPIRDGTWPELAARLGEDRDALVFESYWFPTFIQREPGASKSHTPILTRTWRTSEPKGHYDKVWYAKGFTNTSTAIAMHPNHPLRCSGVLPTIDADAGYGGKIFGSRTKEQSRVCVVRSVKEGVARLHQYGGRCDPRNPEHCEGVRSTSVLDSTLSKLRWPHVAAEVDRVLQKIRSSRFRTSPMPALDARPLT